VIRSGRDKAAFYRMWHLHQHTGVRRPDTAAPGPAVPFEQALVALGEETGKMDDVLRLLADYFEAEDRATQKALRHAAYPMFTALIAVFIAPLPLIFLGRTGAYFSAVTLGVLLWGVAAFGIATGNARWYLNRPKYVLGRLLRALTIAVEAGLGLERASQLAAEASGNDAVVAHVRRQTSRQRARQPLAETFRGCPYVPFTAIAAMEVADVSGDYGGTLKKLAELHDR